MPAFVFELLVLGYGSLVRLPAFVFELLVLGYYILMEGYLGQTVGKMATGIKVVRENTDEVPGLGPAAIRTVLRIVDGLFLYLVAFITVLVSGKRQRLGDMAAHTQVVHQVNCQSHNAAHRLLHLAGFEPAPVWGRDEHLTGDMWNSNSAISWLLSHSGVPTEELRPPAGGRAPGWTAGLVIARRQQLLAQQRQNPVIEA